MVQRTGVWELGRYRTPGDGLQGYRLLRRISNCVGDWRFLQGQRLPQDHFHRCSNVEEKIVRAGEQHQRRHETDSTADCRTDDGAFPLVGRNA